jgi:maltose-binding protein MalE
MRILGKVLVVLFSALLLIAFAACEKEGPAERAGKKVDETVEKAQQKMEETGDKVSQQMEEAGKKVEEATEK